LDHGVNDHPELDAKFIRYADDFVLLCRPGSGEAMLERLEKYGRAKGLKLNAAKTRLVNFQQESFRLFGFDFPSHLSNGWGPLHPARKPGCICGMRSVRNSIIGQNTAAAPRQSDG